MNKKDEYTKIVTDCDYCGNISLCYLEDPYGNPTNDIHNNVGVVCHTCLTKREVS